MESQQGVKYLEQLLELVARVESFVDPVYKGSKRSSFLLDLPKLKFILSKELMIINTH